MKRKVGKIFLGVVIAVCVVLVGAVLVLGAMRQSRVATAGEEFPEFEDEAKAREIFPEFESEEMVEKRKEILRIVKREWEGSDHEMNLADFYEEGRKYAEGAEEPWCADFVSWVYREAGMEFENPVSGGWRIPGIYTLRDYFVQEGRWRSLESGYTPVPGDVVIYEGGLFGGHTNIVVGVGDDGTITAVGGNENQTILMQKYKYSEGKYGVLGFGVLE